MRTHIQQDDGGHIVIFPFMAKGHTIPLVHLAAHLTAHHPNLRITFITTPANAPFLQTSLPSTVHLIILPFEPPPWATATPAALPSRCESTDLLPSIDLHDAFLALVASSLLRPFDSALTSLVRSPHPPLALISDFFLGWTLPVCLRLSLPRIVFHGMSAFSMSLCKSLFSVNLPALREQPDVPFHVPGTPPSLALRIADVPGCFFEQPAPIHIENAVTDVESWGVLVNSFPDLEGEYAGLFESFYTQSGGGRAWLVGPLCMLGENQQRDKDRVPDDVADECLRWLDEQEAGSVVYVSFGTQADVAEEQMEEVAPGLAQSGCKFLWSVPRGRWAHKEEGRIKIERSGAGKMVRWAPQRAVLGHRATGGFVSHCGWNSVVEAVAAGVPLLTWAMMAEQALNAKMVVDVLKMGVRISGSTVDDGGILRRERVAEGVRELMVGAEGKKARERAVELRKKAEAAVAEGGSSPSKLEEMIEELRKYHDNGLSQEGDVTTSTAEDEEEVADRSAASNNIKFHELSLLGGEGIQTA